MQNEKIEKIENDKIGNKNGRRRNVTWKEQI